MNLLRQHQTDSDLIYSGLGICILCAIFCAMLARISYLDTGYLSRVQNSGTHVDGLLTTVKTNYHTGGSKGAGSWSINVEYEYTVNSKKYIGTEIGEIDYAFLASDGIQGILDNYKLKENNFVTVHYNSKNPTETYLFDNGDFTNSKTWGLVILSILGLIGSVYFWLQRKKIKKT